METVLEFFVFLVHRRKYWLWPFALILLFLGVFLIAAKSSAIGALLYTFFSMYILGISAFYHDSAACLIKDDEIIAAAQEERFSRIKNDAAFPVQSIRYCLGYAGITMSDIGYVVYYEKPFLKFERLLESYLSTAPQGMFSFLKAIPVWIREKIFQKRIITAQLAELCSSWKKTTKDFFSLLTTSLTLPLHSFLPHIRKHW